MDGLGRAALGAAAVLALAPSAQKDAALAAAARAVRHQRAAILAANAQDMAAARAREPGGARLERLLLDAARVEGIARSLEEVVALPDPIGSIAAEWQRPNGLTIRRVRVPLGVIGIIYESRPNVTADAGALCLKSGNAVILRGGSGARTRAARCMPVSWRASRLRGCRRRASSWCPPPTARRSATCSRAWAITSMSSCRAAARPWCSACSRRPACR